MITDVLLLVWCHFIGDYFLQSNKMATEKRRHLGWLALHAITYAIPLLYFGIIYAVWNSMAHFVVDFFTSRYKVPMERNVHLFFLTMGLDQAIHLTILVASYCILA